MERLRCRRVGQNFYTVAHPCGERSGGAMAVGADEHVAGAFKVVGEAAARLSHALVAFDIHDAICPIDLVHSYDVLDRSVPAVEVVPGQVTRLLTDEPGRFS
ncbi:MAG: hypothetical protein WD021_09695, partial [Rhodothermales bacterium]